MPLWKNFLSFQILCRCSQVFRTKEVDWKLWKVLVSVVCVCVYINISQIKGRLSKASLDRVILRLRQNVWGNMPFIVSISFILRKPWPYILPTTSHVKGSYFFWRLVRDLLKSCITIDCLVTIQKSNHFNILWPWLNSCYEVTMEYDR